MQWKAPQSGCLSEQGRRGAPLSKILPPVYRGERQGESERKGQKRKKESHQNKNKGKPPHGQYYWDCPSAAGVYD